MRLRALRLFASLSLAAALCGVAPASAADAKAIGTFDAWTAYSYGDGKAKVCYVHAVPQKSDGEYNKRGATYLQVSHRPAEKALNVVSVTAGYAYKQGSEAEAVIDGNKYALFTNGEGAWTADAKADAALVAAMKAGNQLVVRGTSGRGTLTSDTYSLKGFTAAIAAINKACGVR